MNSRFDVKKAGLFRIIKNKRFVLSIVILFEVIAIMVVATFAWVETVSSVKIFGTSGLVDTFVCTDAEITSQQENWTRQDGIIDLAHYFKRSGDMHLAPASSSDGKNMFFPQVASASYRKGNANDKNTSYMSISFKVRAETNVDFFFYKPANGDGPSFSGSNIDGEDIRVSVTAYSEGTSPEPEDTKLYGLSESSDDVINSTSSTNNTGTANVMAFSDHVKGTGSVNRLFAVAAEETKIVTINLWLQSNSTNMNGSNILSNNITLNDFGIISSLTPRRVTLVPGSVWRNDSPVYYAWCFEANNGAPDKLYKLTENIDGTYCFDYPGNYENMVFVRTKPETADHYDTGDIADSTFWNTYAWNQTEDAPVPELPVDPTYFIYTISGSSQTWGQNNDKNKSTGDWENPAVIKLKYVDGQDDSWGDISGVYDGFESIYDASDSKEARMITRGNVNNGSTFKFKANTEVTNVSGQSYSNYAFVGWYTDSAGTNSAGFTNPTVSGNKTTYERNTPAKDTETTYYAKFKEVRTIKVVQYKDGSASSIAGTVYVDTNSGTSSASKTVNKGSQIELYAVANAGYTLQGIYTNASGTTPAGTTEVRNGITYYTVTANDNDTYYARFTTNSYNVVTHACYTTDGTNYTNDDATGGTVQSGNATAGATSTKSVTYNSSVVLKASSKGGYEFIGWYNGTETSATRLSTDTSYTYSLTSASNANVYARFKLQHFYLTGFINGADESGTTHAFTYSSGSTFTYTYKFTGADKQYITIFDGTNAYHPGEHKSGSGTDADLSKTDTTPAGPNGNKWEVKAPKGATVTFTWDWSLKRISWTIDSRELFLKPGTNWTSSNPRFAAYVFGDGTDWYNMTSAGNGYYKVTVPANYPNIIFTRMKGDSTTNNFNNPPCWNKTGDLTIPEDKNCFTVADDSWNGATTTWSLY